MAEYSNLTCQFCDHRTRAGGVNQFEKHLEHQNACMRKSKQDGERPNG